MSRISSYALKTTPVDDDYTVIVDSEESNPARATKRVYFAAFRAAALGALNVRSFGAIGDGVTDDTDAVRDAVAAMVTQGKPLYVPTPSAYYKINRGFRVTGNHSGLGIFGDGISSVIKFGTTIDEAADIEAGWMCILDGATDGALTDFELSDIVFDGNRAGVTGFDPANTCVGVIGYQDSDFEDVVVRNVTARNFLQGSGFGTFAGGIEFLNCTGSGNEYHGGYASRSTTFGDAKKIARWINFRGHNNDGYGLDLGRYSRCYAEGVELNWNTEGGMKYSIGTEYLKVRGAELSYNLNNGLQDTDTVGTGTFDFDGIYSHHNGGQGIRIVSATHMTIGTIISANNYCRTSAARSGDWYTGGSLTGADLQIGTGSGGSLVYWSAGKLISRESPTRGIYIDGVGMRAVIDYVEGVGAENAGFSSQMTGSAKLVVKSGLMKNNNQAGTAASAAAAAFVVENDGVAKITGIIFDDNQGVVTQHSGFYFSSGVEAEVDMCDFGTGIAGGSQVYSATAGTRVRFGKHNTGITTYAEGTFTGNGGGTNFTATFALALSALGGVVFRPKFVTPVSADAANLFRVDNTGSSTTQRTQLDVVYAAATPAGAGNISFSYYVEMEILR